MEKIIRFFKLPWRRKELLLEAALGFTMFRILTFTIPFRWLAKIFGEPGKACPGKATPPPQVLHDIKWAVHAAAKIVPWGKKCLVQSATAKVMARLRGCRTTYFLGVGRDEQKRLTYHAWLQYYDFIITGGKTDGVYETLNSFY